MNKPNNWLMFAVLLLCAILVGVSQLKIAAVLPDVAALLNVDMTKAALLMSLFTVAGIVLSIPGAAFMNRFGAKNTLMLLMLTLALGNFIGALTESFPVMMFSRVIEGISYALIITVGIALINIWFTESSAALATGFFNIFAAAANFVSMNASLVIRDQIGIKALWWITAASAVVCFLLVLILVHAPKFDAGSDDSGKRVKLGDAFKNPAAMTVCVLHLCLAFILFGFITCYPQLFAFYGLDQATSNFFSSLNGLFGMPVCIICGMIVAKTGKPFVIAIIGAIGCILLSFTMPYLGPETYVAHVIASAIFPGGLVMTSVFIIVPRLCKSPALVGITMGILNTLYYIGVFASTPLITALSQENTTWQAPSLLMTAASAVVLICAATASLMNRKQTANSAS
ncbi:MAG: MFS transporter [Clostridiales bacterium]|nr:MFS transporter [Clostridiales bacterium]